MKKIDTSYLALYQAWNHFRKGKQATLAIDAFAYNLEANLVELSRAITTKTYRHGGYQRVVLKEKKRRDLAVAGIQDRVVHRLLYDFLLDSFDPTFDFDVWSCRQGKGLHACLGRTQALLGTLHNSFVWRGDIVKFFDNVHHQELLGVIARKHAADTSLLWLCQEVIASYHLPDSVASNESPLHGIPIGNLTSQIFANIYLNEFDRFVRHQLKPLAYLRYGDVRYRKTLHHLGLPYDDYAQQTWNPDAETTQVAAFGADKEEAEQRHDGFEVSMTGIRGYLVDAIVARIKGIDPRSAEFPLNQGFMRMPEDMERRTVGGDSIVGNVNSNEGQLKLDRSNGNANSNEGVGVSVRQVIKAPSWEFLYTLSPAAKHTADLGSFGLQLMQRCFVGKFLSE